MIRTFRGRATSRIIDTFHCRTRSSNCRVARDKPLINLPLSDAFWNVSPAHRRLKTSHGDF